MPEIPTQPQSSAPTSVFRKFKKLLNIIIIPFVLLLIILYILAWVPWVTDGFARERVLSSLGSSCRELQQGEYEPPVSLLIYKIPTLRERLGLEPLFGNNITLYLLCDGKGLTNEYFVSFYGSTKLVSSGNVMLKNDSKKDETADWEVYSGKEVGFSLKYPNDLELAEAVNSKTLGIEGIYLGKDRYEDQYGSKKVYELVYSYYTIRKDLNNSTFYKKVSGEEINEPQRVPPTELTGWFTYTRLPNTTVDGFTAFRTKTVPDTGSPNVFIYSIHIKAKNDYYYIDTRGDTEDEFESRMKTLDQILSTFKFLD